PPFARLSVSSRGDLERPRGELQHRAGPPRGLWLGPEVRDDQGPPELRQGRGKPTSSLLSLQVDRLAEDRRGERAAAQEDGCDPGRVGTQRRLIEVPRAPRSRIEVGQHGGGEERGLPPDEPAVP